MQIYKIKLHLLLAEKLSSKDLAEMAEISPQTISKIIKMEDLSQKLLEKLQKH